MLGDSMLTIASHRFVIAMSVAMLSLNVGRCADTGVEAPVVRVVTLEEALAAASSIPDVVAATASERAADAGIRAARAPGEPSLTLATRSVTARESLAVSVPFRWGGQRGTAVDEAKAERETAARSREAAIATARRLCRVAWVTLAAAEDRLRAADELVARSETNRRAIDDLLEVQRASRLDAARAKAEWATASASRAAAEQAVVAASAELRALLGADVGRLSAGESRPTPPPEAALSDWRQRALASSPDVVIAAAELRTAEARVARRARERLPATSLEAGADWNDPTQPGTDALLGLGITFPTRGGAALDAARADRDRAAALLELARRRVDADVETAWSSVAAARARFQAVDELAQPAAVESAELTRIAYREGKLDLFRLLDAERALAESERDHAEAYRDWGVAFADLLRLAPEGTP
jgi:outer membrane protein TolC